MTDHYETLGVDKNASKDEIKKAYRKKSKGTHPDHGGDEKAQTALTVAYNTLKVQDKRDKYDRGEQDRPAPKTEKFEEYIFLTFDAIINEQIAGKFRGDVVKEVKARMIRASQQNQGLAGVQRQLIKALESKLDRVKTEGETVNYYQNLVTQKIQGANATILRCEEEIENVRKGLIALGHYRDMHPDKPLPPAGPGGMPGGQGGRGGSYYVDPNKDNLSSYMRRSKRDPGFVEIDLKPEE